MLEKEGTFETAVRTAAPRPAFTGLSIPGAAPCVTTGNSSDRIQLKQNDFNKKKF